jgi:hypothetical protein
MKTYVNLPSRLIVRVAVLLVVACLVSDMAMPLLPGAFRLAPSESIEATAGRMAATAVVATDRSFVRADVASPRIAAERSLQRVVAFVAPPGDTSRFRPRASTASSQYDTASASDDD